MDSLSLFSLIRDGPVSFISRCLFWELLPTPITLMTFFATVPTFVIVCTSPARMFLITIPTLLVLFRRIPISFTNPVDLGLVLLVPAVVVVPFLP